MKKSIILAVSLLTMSVAIIAGIGSKGIDTREKMIGTNNASFHKIVINNDIDVVLTEATDNHIEIKGEEKNVKRVSFNVKEGTLYIRSKNSSMKNKVVVYVSVTQLELIEVNGSSNVTTNGFLQSDKLKVQVNAEANFRLKNKGQIFFETNDELYLHFKHLKGPQQPAHMQPEYSFF